MPDLRQAHGVKQGRYGPFLSCTGYPGCRTLAKISADQPPRLLTAEEIAALPPPEPKPVRAKAAAKTTTKATKTTTKATAAKPRATATKPATKATATKPTRATATKPATKATATKPKTTGTKPVTSTSASTEAASTRSRKQPA